MWVQKRSCWRKKFMKMLVYKVLVLKKVCTKKLLFQVYSIKGLKKRHKTSRCKRISLKTKTFYHDKVWHCRPTSCIPLVFAAYSEVMMTWQSKYYVITMYHYGTTQQCRCNIYLSNFLWCTVLVWNSLDSQSKYI